MQILNFISLILKRRARACEWYRRDMSLMHQIGFNAGQVQAIVNIQSLYSQKQEYFAVYGSDGMPTRDSLEAEAIQLLQCAVHDGVPVETLYEGQLIDDLKKHPRRI